MLKVDIPIAIRILQKLAEVQRGVAGASASNTSTAAFSRSVAGAGPTGVGRGMVAQLSDPWTTFLARYSRFCNVNSLLKAGDEEEDEDAFLKNTWEYLRTQDPDAAADEEIFDAGILTMQSAWDESGGHQGGGMSGVELCDFLGTDRAPTLDTRFFLFQRLFHIQRETKFYMNDLWNSLLEDSSTTPCSSTKSRSSCSSGMIPGSSTTKNTRKSDVAKSMLSRLYREPDFVALLFRNLNQTLASYLFVAKKLLLREETLMDLLPPEEPEPEAGAQPGDRLPRMAGSSRSSLAPFFGRCFDFEMAPRPLLLVEHPFHVGSFNAILHVGREILPLSPNRALILQSLIFFARMAQATATNTKVVRMNARIATLNRTGTTLADDVMGGSAGSTSSMGGVQPASSSGMRAGGATSTAGSSSAGVLSGLTGVANLGAAAASKKPDVTASVTPADRRAVILEKRFIFGSLLDVLLVFLVRNATFLQLQNDQPEDYRMLFAILDLLECIVEHYEVPDYLVQSSLFYQQKQTSEDIVRQIVRQSVRKATSAASLRGAAGGAGGGAKSRSLPGGVGTRTGNLPDRWASREQTQMEDVETNESSSAPSSSKKRIAGGSGSASATSSSDNVADMIHGQGGGNLLLPGGGAPAPVLESSSQPMETTTHLVGTTAVIGKTSTNSFDWPADGVFRVGEEPWGSMNEGGAPFRVSDDDFPTMKRLKRERDLAAAQNSLNLPSHAAAMGFLLNGGGPRLARTDGMLDLDSDPLSPIHPTHPVDEDAVHANGLRALLESLLQKTGLTKRTRRRVVEAVVDIPQWRGKGKRGRSDAAGWRYNWADSFFSLLQDLQQEAAAMGG